MASKIKSQSIDELFTAILSLQNLEECYMFFEDIATIPEIKSLAQRLEVAKMVAKDETYIAISKKTGASTATISRVKNCILYGAGGYDLALSRTKQESEEK